MLCAQASSSDMTRITSSKAVPSLRPLDGALPLRESRDATSSGPSSSPAFGDAQAHEVTAWTSYKAEVSMDEEMHSFSSTLTDQRFHKDVILMA